MGRECIEWWRAAGGDLFDWQEMVIEAMLGLGEDERWVSPEDGLDVARQNGKGVILQAVEGFFAFELDYPVVMHTAHEFATSQEHQLRLEALIQDAPHLHSRVKDRGGYMHANGRESINLKSGCRIIFKARTKGGGRGYSGDLLVWDEAMVIPDAVVGAQKPMTRASRSRHGQKTIFAGSAVDQEVQEYGVNFARLRERGIARAPRVSWHEWSAPFDDPDALDEAAMRDRSLWLSANPSMAAGLVSEETMADEIESMPYRIAAVELLGVGDWPVTDRSKQTVIDMDLWAALKDPGSRIVGQVSFAFDVSPNRSAAAISAAGRRSDGLFHVEVVEMRDGTGWLPARLAELLDSHETAGVSCDGAGPASSLIPALADLEVEVEVVTGPDHADACGFIFDLVDQAGLRHLGTAELTSALRGAAQRPLGERWAWARKQSKVNITPLVSGTLALWGAHTAVEELAPMVGFG